MRAALFLLVTSAILGSLEAQYAPLGCSRQVTLPSTTYTVPTYQPQCQCCHSNPPPRPHYVQPPYNPYNHYCQPSFLQQNIVPPPPPPPVYQTAPIYVPIPTPPNCSCASCTVQQQSSEPGHPHGPPSGHSSGNQRHSHPGPTPHQGYTSIPGLSDADSKRLVPNLGNIGGHNTPVVVQSVIVGKKEKETEEKGGKEKDKGESCKKKQPKKKYSEEVDDDEHDHEERSWRRKRRRRGRKTHRRSYHDIDPQDSWDPEVYDPCDECTNGNSGGPRLVYFSNK